MNASPRFRPAVQSNARHIAELVEIASDGVALIEWTERAALEPGLSPIDVGTRVYARDDGDCSYRNCTIADVEGQVAGLLLCYPMAARDPGSMAAGPPFDGSDILAPYKYLEEPGSWYICALACYPAYRGFGIGSQLIQLAHRQARERGFERLSLVVFEQNEGAVRLYQRRGFREAKRAPMIPHPLIRYRGDALLMTVDA